MRNPCLILLIIILFSVSLPSCDQPTYSKEKVKESIIKLCKDEYNLDVKVKIIGTTLGVYIPIEGLVDPDLKLNEDAGEKIEDVALSIHRVTMSTNRPLKIYALTARDIKTVGAEFVLIGFIYDVIRVRLLDISRGEYYKRILRDFRFNPELAGQTKIKELFNTLNKNSPMIQGIKSLFYPIYTIGKKGSQKIEIIEIHSKEISTKEALIYIKTKEFYEPLPGFEVYRAIFPPGFTNEYLALIDISMFPNPIKEIVPKYFYSGTEIRQRNLKATFDQYKDIGYIGLDGFPKKELETDWFLSQQIARRIKILFETDKSLKERFKVQSTNGYVENKIFRFTFIIIPNESSPVSKEMIFSRILKLVGWIFHRYSFDDYIGIEFIDASPGGKKIYLSKDDLERFRNNKIKIEDILLNRYKNPN